VLTRVAGGECGRKALIAFLVARRLKVEELRPIAWNNWGTALEDLARATLDRDPDAARQLFEDAFEKYHQATQAGKDFHEAWYNWGNTLGDLAWALDDGEEKAQLREEAIAKVRTARRVVGLAAPRRTRWRRRGLDVEVGGGQVLLGEGRLLGGASPATSTSTALRRRPPHEKQPAGQARPLRVPHPTAGGMNRAATRLEAKVGTGWPTSPLASE